MYLYSEPWVPALACKREPVLPETDAGYQLRDIRGRLLLLTAL